MRLLQTTTALTAAIALCSCTLGYEEDVGELARASEVTNQIKLNQIKLNQIKLNQIKLNQLSAAGLADAGWLDEMEDDEDLRLVFEYLYSCAMPKDAPIEIGGVTYDGGLGVAPEWADPPKTYTWWTPWGRHSFTVPSCGLSCQRAVSACMIARLNATGTQIPISLRGPGIELEPEELEDFTFFEAVFFGNIFTQPMELYACSGTAFPTTTVTGGARSIFESYLQGRICTLDEEDCGIVNVGSCTYATRAGKQCVSHTVSGSVYYTDCLTVSPNAAPLGESYHETMTVYVDDDPFVPEEQLPL